MARLFFFPSLFFSLHLIIFLNSTFDRLKLNDRWGQEFLGSLHHAAAGLNLLQPLGEVVVARLQLVHLVQC